VKLSASGPNLLSLVGEGWGGGCQGNGTKELCPPTLALPHKGEGKAPNPPPQGGGKSPEPSPIRGREKPRTLPHKGEGKVR